MAESVIKSFFPSQVASDEDKLGLDYGLKIQEQLKMSGLKKMEGQPAFQVTKLTSII